MAAARTRSSPRHAPHARAAPETPLSSLCRRLSAFALFAVLASSAPASAQYRIVEIVGPGDVFPAAVNASGKVAGTMTQLTNPVNQPWMWDGDSLHILSIPSVSGFATDINDAGVVVGYATAPPTFNARPYRWVNGVAEEIPMPGPAYVRGYAWAINDSGVVLLELATSTNAGIYALWDGSSHTMLPAPGVPRALNNLGHRAGALGADALAWLPDLVTLDRDGALSARAVAINDSGRIVGNVLRAVGEPFEAVYWDGDSSPTPIPGMTELTSVNRFGVMVGKTDDGPALVQGDTLLYFQSVVAIDSDLELDNSAVLVNDAGVLVCAGSHADEADPFVVGVVLIPGGSDLVVNDARDLPDTNLDDGVCDADGGTAGPQCTLRAAIENANRAAGRDSIPFDIPGAGPHVITLASPLPAITEPIVLDAMRQPGWADGAPAVTLTGVTGDGLVLSVGESSVRGLAIGGFAGAGVKITGPGGNRVVGCALGTNAAGTPLPNRVGVIVDGSPGNRIGPGNRIAGNTAHGVHVNGASAADNRIEGNIVGANADGSAAVPNGGSGVRVENAPRTIVGGADAAANLISGNGLHGVQVIGVSDGTRVIGNLIGTNAAGDAAIANGASADRDTGHVGVSIEHAGQITVGGSEALGNVIAANVGGGVRVSADLATGAPAPAAEITGNRIGADASGQALLGNGGPAVHLRGAASGARVGKPGAGNVILVPDTTFEAIRIVDMNAGGSPDDVTIQSNLIGLSADGAHVLGSSAVGVGVTSTVSIAFAGVSDLTIGGSGAGNSIASARSGIFVLGAATENAKIVGNRIGIRPDGALAGGLAGKAGILALRTPGLVVEENAIGGFQAGLVLGADGARVTGNRIGTESSGSSARPNVTGVLVLGEFRVNGSVAGSTGDLNEFVGNVISGNTGAGLVLGGTADFTSESDPSPALSAAGGAAGTPDENIVLGNRIGTDATGTAAVGNGVNEQSPGPGLWVLSGENNIVLGNVISGNGIGLVVGSADGSLPPARATRVGANLIGATLDGNTIPNRAGGVLIDRSDDNVLAPMLVPGNTAAQPNVIRGNLGAFAVGVRTQAGAGVRNVIRRGPIFGNEGPSIRHGDADHPGQRPANVPAPPVMVSALVEGTQMNARILPQTTGAVDVYLSQSCVQGIAQGLYVKSVDGVTGVAADITLPAVPTDTSSARVGWFLATTSTRSGADSTTSEFSTCMPIADVADTALGVVAPGATGLALSGGGVDVVVDQPPPLAVWGGVPSGVLYAARHRFQAPNDSLAGTAATPGGAVIAPDVIASDRYWTVAQEGLDGATCTVCVDVSGPEFAHPQQLVLARRDVSSDPWTPLDSSLQPGTGLLCAAGVTRFGEFTVAADSSNLTTAVDVALATAEATPDRVTLTWWGAGAAQVAARVERRGDGDAAWAEIGRAVVVGPDELRWVDTRVEPGARYAYRLAYVDEGRERRTAETWVQIPVGVGFALEALRPNPSKGPREVVFTLAEPGAVKLDLFDVSGRAVWSHAGTLAAGRHVVSLRAASLAPGVYLVRLRQGAREATTRGVVVR